MAPRSVKEKEAKRNFNCPLCTYVTKYVSSLKLHLLRHTGEKPYSCNLCPFKCNTKGNLQRHIERCKRKLKLIKCNKLDELDEKDDSNCETEIKETHGPAIKKTRINETLGRAIKETKKAQTSARNQNKNNINKKLRKVCLKRITCKMCECNTEYTKKNALSQKMAVNSHRKRKQNKRRLLKSLPVSTSRPLRLRESPDYYGFHNRINRTN